MNAKVTSSHIRGFLQYYRKKLEEGFEMYSTIAPRLQDAQSRINSVIERGGKIFAFGNGGSYAIASSILLDLREKCPPECRRQIERPLGIHETLRYASTVGYERVFEQILREEGLAGDLVVLVSSSGKSKNIVYAAEQAREQGIGVISVTNNHSHLGYLSDITLCTPLGDQQPGEDISLIFGRAMARSCFKDASLKESKTQERSLQNKELESQVLEGKNQFLAFVESMGEDWLLDLTMDICNKYVNGGRVFIYAPQGGAQSLAAHHIAHNLQWDGLMDVARIGRFQIHTRISDVGNLAHFSGVSNDRSGDLFHARQLLFEGEPGDVALLFGQDPTNPYLKNAVAAIQKVKMRGYAGTYGGVSPAWRGIRQLSSMSRLSSEWIYECGLQVLGHLLGRTIRTLLFAKNGTNRELDLGEFLQFELAELKNRERGVVELKAELRMRSDENDREKTKNQIRKRHH